MKYTTYFLGLLFTVPFYIFAAEPSVVSFEVVASSNLESTPEETPIPFLWTTISSAGVNLRISCNEHISATITTESASSIPKCATLAFTNALPANGAATILFVNNSTAPESITVTLVPMRTNGDFDATHGKELTFRVLPNSTSVNASETPSQFSSITPKSLTEAPTEVPVFKKTFAKNLARGSQGDDVVALQEFLKQDPAIYPEGIVIGIFGPATERAVKRLQVKYQIANVGVPGYGNVGPKTRALINSLNK